MKTYIIPEHPGYMWVVDGEKRVMIYEPVKGWYSPPVLDRMISHRSIEIPSEMLQFMGAIIGKDGVNFKTITSRYNGVYIFYRQDLGVIEAWALPEHLDEVETRIRSHMDTVRDRVSKTGDVVSLYVSSKYIPIMGLVIGKEGRHLKEIARRTGCVSIIYQPLTQNFDIRSDDPIDAIMALEEHMSRFG